MTSQRDNWRIIDIECKCPRLKHIVRVELIYPDGIVDPTLHIHVRDELGTSIFSRIKFAVQYVLTGRFHSIHLSKEQISRINKLILTWGLISSIRKRRRMKKR